MATYQELLQQQKELAAQIEAARKRELSDAVSKVRALIAEYGLTEKDLFPAGRRGAGAKSAGAGAGAKVPPKYRDPATGQTWTGRGKAPKWIEGKNREQFLIA